jgi:hypothetical protein
MGRWRVFFASCFLAGIALSAYAMQRWPVHRVSSEEGGFRNEFIRSADRGDRLLATADYIAAVLLFAVWPWARIREGRWRGWPPYYGNVSFAEKLEGGISLLSLGLAAAMGLVGLGAVISLFRA